MISCWWYVALSFWLTNTHTHVHKHTHLLLKCKKFLISRSFWLRGPNRFQLITAVPVYLSTRNRLCLFPCLGGIRIVGTGTRSAQTPNMCLINLIISRKRAIFVDIWQLRSARCVLIKQNVNRLYNKILMDSYSSRVWHGAYGHHYR